MQSISKYYPRKRFCHLISGFRRKYAVGSKVVSSKGVGNRQYYCLVLAAYCLLLTNSLCVALILLRPFYSYGANFGLPGSENARTFKQENVEKALKEAKFLVETEQYLEAIIKLQKAIQTNPAYVEAYELLAKSYHAERMMAKAIRYYKKALELKPNSEETNYNLAIALIEVRRYKEALGYLEKVISLNPKHERAKRKMAEIRGK